jgi:hypothetical protein
MATVYKVRNKNTGLYSKGGSYNGWSAQGKTFDTLGKLRSFITRSLNSNYARQFVPEFEIEEYEVRHTSTKQVHEIIDPKKLFGMIAKEY